MGASEGDIPDREHTTTVELEKYVAAYHIMMGYMELLPLETRVELDRKLEGVGL